MRGQNFSAEDGLGEGVRICVTATPNADEEDVCSACLHIMLNSDYPFHSIRSNIRVRLPDKATPPAENCSLFPSQSAESKYEDINSFEIFAEGGEGRESALISVSITQKSLPGVNFIDIRKWTPQFDLRIGENQCGPFLWKKGETKQWEIELRVTPTTLLQSSRFPLSSEVAQQIKENGFVRFPGLVQADFVTAALRIVNGGIGKSGDARDLSFIGKEFSFLFNETPIRALVETLIKDVPDWAGSSCQVALVYPDSNPASKPLDMRHYAFHIDGIPTKTNGLVEGKLSPFDMLVGVYLRCALTLKCDQRIGITLPS